MTSNGATTNYAYDGQTMTRELNGAPGSLHATATYLTGPRGPEYRRDDTQPEPDGQGHTFGRTRWYVYDGLGSVVGEVDPAGNVTCSDKYDVYGAVRGRTGTASTAHGFVGSLGHLSDTATGLVYMRARYYDPSVGRFTSEDSARSGNNWFQYADGNPINEVDKTGKASSGLWGLFMQLFSGLNEGAGTNYGWRPLIMLACNALSNVAQSEGYPLAGDLIKCVGDLAGVVTGLALLIAATGMVGAVAALAVFASVVMIAVALSSLEGDFGAAYKDKWGADPAP